VVCVVLLLLGGFFVSSELFHVLDKKGSTQIHLSHATLLLNV
jgi:hypothetical protein